ncbi:hypothetical protein [Nocardioides sp. B-3]|uniref:hypothetical protein n=1 Tax=Nocardioides sp. B-3 TaxID=2895565 RepID=UPI0021523C79|nr:hypothetical protein [Nocardioides sp. B-3]UUZ60043.1 hypothetical protein LP418_03305 [Nocardioides sp. B-3]
MGQARAPHCLPQRAITKAAHQAVQVRIDEPALVGGEVRDFARESERAVLCQLTAGQRGRGQRQVIVESAREEHALLTGVGTGQRHHRDLGADRHRPRRRAQPSWRGVFVLGDIRERRGHRDPGGRGGGLDPLQRFELVEQIGR